MQNSSWRQGSPIPLMLPFPGWSGAPQNGFHYDETDIPSTKPENWALAPLLIKKSGTCANLPDLYYAIAERLGIKQIHMVEAPQHAFLRYELPGGAHINIEAVSGGGEFPDDEVTAAMEIPPAAIKSGWMMRSLSKKEALTLLLGNEARMEPAPAVEQSLFKIIFETRPENADAVWNLAVGKMREGLQRHDERLKAEARGLAVRAREGGLPAPLKPDYVKRQELIAAHFRHAEGVKLPPVPPEAPWDPVQALNAMVELPDRRLAGGYALPPRTLNGDPVRSAAGDRHRAQTAAIDLESIDDLPIPELEKLQMRRQVGMIFEVESANRATRAATQDLGAAGCAGAARTADLLDALPTALPDAQRRIVGGLNARGTNQLGAGGAP
jgi:hypothetical protein